MLTIDNLHAGLETKEILKGFSLHVQPGEVHAIMGPNGAGKSTLAKVLAGHPSYEVNSGEIKLRGEDLLEMDPEQRARKGLFMSFQYPPEVEGVSSEQFLFAAVNACRKARLEETLTLEAFKKLLEETMLKLEMGPAFMGRNLNEGFSGGEKKRSEILQMTLLQPKVAILDETDSGLDIDALGQVARGINAFRSPEVAVVLITHYQRLLDYVKPDFIHVMMEGRIVHSSDATLAHELEAKGYDWLAQQL